MTATITEGAISLELDADSESVLKWDQCNAYTAGVGRLNGSRAVDICVNVLGHGPFYIEMKDYRGVRTQDIALQVAEKVRDTLAGLVWASGRGIGTVGHEALVEAFLERRPRVVVWLETDRADIGGASALQKEIRKQLLPHLHADVIVTSTHLEKLSSRPLTWLRPRGVASLRLARRPRG